MKKDIKLKGTTEIVYAMAGNYDSFPYLMNIWIFRMDLKGRAAYEVRLCWFMQSSLALCIFYNKSLILADMVEFAAQYGIVRIHF